MRETGTAGRRPSPLAVTDSGNRHEWPAPPLVLTLPRPLSQLLSLSLNLPHTERAPTIPADPSRRRSLKRAG